MVNKLAGLCLVGVFFGISFDFVVALRNNLDIKTVTELDVDSYVGRWYEMYSDLVVKTTFERNSYCTTATYGKISTTNITVFNSGRQDSPQGPENSISGYAYVADPAEPGKLKLQFPNIPLGDYWVIALGPVEDNQYQYSVVTEPLMLQLFILARDPDQFRAKYQKETLEFVQKAGFTKFWNKPRKTVQEPDCIYPDPPRKHVHGL